MCIKNEKGVHFLEEQIVKVIDTARAIKEESFYDISRI
jgi:hypothetical protein